MQEACASSGPCCVSCNGTTYIGLPLPGAQRLKREEIAALVNRELPTPSSYAEPTEGGWSDRRFKKVGKYIHFHRTTSDEQPATPVTLLDPILAQVAQQCETASPSEADCEFAIKVAAAMSQSFAEKSARRETFRQLLEDEYRVMFHCIGFIDEATDGSIVHHQGELVMNIEVRNEIGMGGGSIHVKNAAFAAKYVAGVGPAVRGRSVCPTLLLTLAGPNMSLSGAVFSNAFICDQLSPMVSLLWQPHSPLMLQAAQCFTALRSALPELIAHYGSIHSH